MTNTKGRAKAGGAHGADERLAELVVACAVPESPEAAEALRRGLADRSFVVASRAALIVADHRLEGFEPALESAFERFMTDGGRTDKGCAVKTAVAEALCRLNAGRPELFLRGIRHVQFEPVWGGQEDTAGKLRGLCAIALADTGDSDLLFDIIPLLLDARDEARLLAVRALAGTGRRDCELLLRLKALAGDKAPDVLAECMAGLMGMAPARSFPFVAAYLDNSQPAIREGAAVALGQSHLPEAFDLLRRCRDDDPDGGFRRAMLLPIALVRSDKSFAYSLGVIRDEPAEMARAAVAALKLYRSDESRTDEIRKAVRARRAAAVTKEFDEAFT